MQSDASPYILTRLASYLEAQQQSITDQWLIAVKRNSDVDDADRLTHLELVDHLPALYAELCAFLRDRDGEVLQNEVWTEVRTRGEHRWREGYRLDEVLRELEILRRLLATTTLTCFWQMDPDSKSAAETIARTLLGEFFYAVTISSVKEFLRGHHAMTEQLRQANLALQRLSSQQQRSPR